MLGEDWRPGEDGPPAWWLSGGAPNYPKAACAGQDPELWFPTGNGPTIKLALNVCHMCPHEAECFLYAMDTPELAGIWGGTTLAARDRLRAEAA